MSLYSQATHSLVFGHPKEVKKLKQVKERCEEIQLKLSKIEKQLSETELEIARSLTKYQQTESDQKKIKKLKQKKSGLEQGLRTQYDAADQIQRNQQYAKLYYSRVRNDIQNDLNKMTGYQFVVVYYYIKYVMEATSDIVTLEKYLDNMFLPNCGNASIKSNQMKADNSEIEPESSEEVFVDAPESIKIDDEFMNGGLIDNTSSGIGAEVLKKLKEDVKSIESKVAPVATLPSPTFATQIQSIANRVFDKFATKKEEQIQIAKLTEKQHQVDSENQEKAIIKSNEQMLLIQKREEEEWNMKLEEYQRNRQEFEKKLKDRETENERKLNEKRQKREEYENENRRLEEEDLKNFEVYTETIVKCQLAQFRFEAKEKEWSDWLKMLQNSIAKAKSQFSQFENMITFRHEHKNYDIMEELNRVHVTTFGAYHMMYRAWHVAKHYSDNYEDKVFLKILLVNFCTICDKLYGILKSIDSFEISSPDPVRPIRIKFSQINAFDIYNTSKLRMMSKNARMENYKNVPEPKYYDQQSYM